VAGRWHKTAREGAVLGHRDADCGGGWGHSWRAPQIVQRASNDLPGIPDVTDEPDAAAMGLSVAGVESSGAPI
jgi:hypothetical protein